MLGAFRGSKATFGYDITMKIDNLGMHMNRSLAVFLQFLLRDTRIFLQRSKQRILNNGVISPLLLAICFGYILPYVALGDAAKTQSTAIFIGNIVWTMFPLAFFFMMDVLFDLEQERFIDYQMTMLSPRLVLFERILFAGLANFVCMLPFFPIAKLVMQDQFDISRACWLHVAVIMLVGALFLTSFNLFTQLLMKDSMKVDNLWLRCYYPLMVMGGGMFSWPVMNAFSPLLGKITLLNPFIYVTDGLREAILGSGEYFSFMSSVIVLTGLWIVCTLLAFYLFRRRVDHI